MRVMTESMTLFDPEIMDSSILSIDEANSTAQLTNSQYLELAYQESLRKSELILKDEGARRLRLRILLLENENDELHDQLAFEDDRIGALEEERADLQIQLERSEIECQRQQSEVRTQARELSNLKAELNSMNGMSVDSAKQLTEKLSLTRELATLKPELEHLRAQTTHQQTILADKLALQRQVTAMEVELEIAKNASKRVALKEAINAKEEELLKQMDDLRKELSKERREREKAQMAAQKQSAEWESCKAVLDSKVEIMKTKLRGTRDQLKESQLELAQAQAAASKMVVISANTDSHIKNPRKRTAVQISADTAIGTPDGVAVRGKRPAVKRGKPDQTALGEKSLFSITPYLNRTISLAPESPQQAIDSVREAGNIENAAEPMLPTIDEPEEAEKDESPSIAAKPKPRKKTIERNILKEARAGIMNSKGLPLKSGAVGTLEKVNEEHGDENEEARANGALKSSEEKRKTAIQVHPPTSDDTEPKKKKRKLLGTAKTLFDEDDAEATKRPPKITLGQVRSFSKPARDKNGNLGVTVAGFGAFSPLKKDKRGTQASFLA